MCAQAKLCHANATHRQGTNSWNRSMKKRRKKRATPPHLRTAECRQQCGWLAGWLWKIQTGQYHRAAKKTFSENDATNTWREERHSSSHTPHLRNSLSPSLHFLHLFPLPISLSLSISLTCSIWQQSGIYRSEWRALEWPWLLPTAISVWSKATAPI